MRHLDLVEQDDVFELGGISDHGVLADDGRAAQEGAVTHFGLVVDDQRAADVGAVEDLGVLGDPNAFGGVVELVSRKRGAKLEDELLDVGQRFPRVLELLEQRRGDGVRQVIQVGDFHLH